MAAIKRHPQSARLHVGLGIAQYSRGEYQDAVQSFCDAADLAPIRSASLPVSRRDVWCLAGDGRRDHERGSHVRRDAPEKRARALPLRHEPVEGPGGEAPGADDLRRVETLLKRAVQLDPHAGEGVSSSWACCSPSSSGQCRSDRISAPGDRAAAVARAGALSARRSSISGPGAAISPRRSWRCFGSSRAREKTSEHRTSARGRDGVNRRIFLQSLLTGIGAGLPGGVAAQTQRERRSNGWIIPTNKPDRFNLKVMAFNPIPAPDPRTGR